jgi:uncharacterized protein
MTTRDTAWPEGTPCWVDLGADDPAQARAFYSALFGWDIQVGGEETGNYGMCLVDGKAVAGIMGKMSPDQPTVWTTYLASEDVDATVDKIKNAGGQVLVEPMDVMEAGRFAIAADPGGAVFGLWQSREMTGFGLANEPGSVTWNENWSRDFEGNKAFYGTVFGASFGDMSNDDMQYATIDIDGKNAGGIGAMGSMFPAEVPANWNVYFAVGDADGTIAKATELGGTVIAPAMDTPFGRQATLADDQGAPFSIIQLSADQAAQAGT